MFIKAQVKLNLKGLFVQKRQIGKHYKPIQVHLGSYLVKMIITVESMQGLFIMYNAFTTPNWNAVAEFDSSILNKISNATCVS